ncbi:CdaR family protein [Clostridium sp.]|uniref:CdaR family protein n=1 Tax=Clostridium sp. TaxID=1506 RepID=UPI002617E9FC|nr:CdaR family protein [Clostridium sp.]
MDKSKKDKAITIGICILLSIGLWIYVTNVENKMRTTEISKVPVELINADTLKNSKLALSPNQDLSVTLKIEGNTGDINKIKKSDFKVQVDLSEYVWKKGDNRVPVSIADYPITVNVKNTNTLTVLVKIEDLAEKPMKIESNINITPSDGYYASQAIINPNEVTVSGAESAVNRVERLVVQDTKVNVYEDISGNYEIKALDKHNEEVQEINLSINTVNVEVKVSKGKSVKINIPLSGALPDGFKLKGLELGKEYVEVLGDKEFIDGISEISTEAIDLSSIKESKEFNLKVIPPEGIQIAQGEEYVKVKVNILKYSSKEFIVPYTIKGSPKEVKITTGKDKVKVIISGYEIDLEKISEKNIKAYLDLTGFTKEGAFDKAPNIELEGVIGEYNVTSVESVPITVAKEIPTQGPVEEDTNE